MLGPQKFGWATRLLSVVAQVATSVLKLVYIPVLSAHLPKIFIIQGTVDYKYQYRRHKWYEFVE